MGLLKTSAPVMREEALGGWWQIIRDGAPRAGMRGDGPEALKDGDHGIGRPQPQGLAHQR